MVSSEAMTALEQYSWPGNVRELGNVIERATVLVQGKLITPEHLSLPVIHAGEGDPQKLTDGSAILPLRKVLAEVERGMIEKALQLTKWNKSKAANLLQIDRRVLFDKIKEYGLKP